MRPGSAVHAGGLEFLTKKRSTIRPEPPDTFDPRSNASPYTQRGNLMSTPNPVKKNCYLWHKLAQNSLDATTPDLPCKDHDRFRRRRHRRQMSGRLLERGRVAARRFNRDHEPVAILVVGIVPVSLVIVFALGEIETVVLLRAPVSHVLEDALLAVGRLDALERHLALAVAELGVAVFTHLFPFDRRVVDLHAAPLHGVDFADQELERLLLLGSGPGVEGNDRALHLALREVAAQIAGNPELGAVHP